MTKEELIKKVLLQPVQRTWGTYNRICPRCYLRAGHRPQWCCLCGQEMIDMKGSDLSKSLTNLQWIRGAINDEERGRRIGTLIIQCPKLSKVLSATVWQKKKEEVEEILANMEGL